MEKDHSQQKNLLIKLVKAIDLLFRTEKRKYTYLTKEGLALKKIRPALTFFFGKPSSKWRVN